MSKTKPEVTPVSATPAMTKEQEVRFRERATTVKDRVAEMLRAMFSTIDAQRAAAAENAESMESLRVAISDALDMVYAAAPKCGRTDCEHKATRREQDNGGFLCDRHTNGRVMQDCKWAVVIRELKVLPPRSTNESATSEPVTAKE